jgi:hypothetical protein
LFRCGYLILKFLKGFSMNISVKFLSKNAVAVCFAVAASASMAGPIVSAVPTTVTPTTSVSLPSQNVAPGSGAYDIQYVFQSNVGSVFANVNGAPATITSATLYQVSGIGGGAPIGATTNLSSTSGGNFALTYSTVVGGYYALNVFGTAPTQSNSLISGQISPVPAPAVLGLVGIGLLGLGLARKARRA